MYRANLYLHPHTHHTKSTTIPGAYPSSVVKGSANTDFTRTIQLNTDKPSQAIGRSSRNESKGLFAAPNNGFFDSPVMSRSHAEVRMVLEPHRKIIIQDTKSMHGTFVNGLQLHPNETAELQDGTEVTFGAEVSRGEDVYPAKTFRIEVGWERLGSAPPQTAQSRTAGGYGVASEDLEYETNDEEEDYEEEDDRLSTSSGRSSPSESPSSPAPLEKPALTSGMSTRLCDEAAPESHERSTKDLKMLNKDFDEKTAEIKEMISRELEVIDLRNDEIIKANNSHPRMPTILSLVNKIQTEKPSNETAPKRCFGVVDLIDDSDDNDDNDLKIIEKPACFNAKSITAEKADIQPPPSSQAVFIDLDEPLSDEEDSGFLYMDSECEIDDDDESVDEEEEEVFVQGEALINQEEGSSKAKTPEREVQSSPAQSSSGSESPCTSEPSSPPDVMSSKSLNSWLGTDHLPIHAPGQVTTPPAALPPIGRLGSPLPIVHQIQHMRAHLLNQRLQQQNMEQLQIADLLSHQRQQQQQLSSLQQRTLQQQQNPRWPRAMESKKEFFDARAENFEKVSAEMYDNRPSLDFYIAPLSRCPDNLIRASRNPWYPMVDPMTPTARLDVAVSTAASSSTPLPDLPTPSLTSREAPSSTAKPPSTEVPAIKCVMFTPQANKPQEASEPKNETNSESAMEVDKEEKSNATVPDEGVCDEDGDYDEEGDYEVGDYYCEMESEDEDAPEADISEELEGIYEKDEVYKKPCTAEKEKTGYSKFSIDDMMNHESPKFQADAVPSNPLLTSNIPSEKSATGVEKTKTVSALEDILNPTTPPNLKRKRYVLEDEPASPLATVSEKQDAPEVVDTEMVEDYPELAFVEQTFEKQESAEEEQLEAPPAKRVKSGRGYIGLATAYMAGAVMGGVGVFAALVATAQ